MAFNDLDLQNKRLISYGGDCCLVTWAGDKIVKTIERLLILAGFKVENNRGVLGIFGAQREIVSSALKNIIDNSIPSDKELAKDLLNKQFCKYDYLIPEELLDLENGNKFYDTKAAITWLANANKYGQLD